MKHIAISKNIIMLVVREVQLMLFRKLIIVKKFIILKEQR